MADLQPYISKILRIELYDVGLLRLHYGKKHARCGLNSVKEQKQAAIELDLSPEGILDAISKFRTTGTDKFFVRNLQSSDAEQSFLNLNSRFPGVNRQYIGCLISATTCRAETPLIICSGPSGAGKSGTVHLAAGIMGFRVKEAVWDGSPGRAVKAMEEAQRVRASFLLFDEFTKYAKCPDGNLLDAALVLTRTRFQWCPPIIFTDIRCPEALTKLRQITRRARFFQLEKRVYWPDPSSISPAEKRQYEGLITESYRMNWRIQKDDEQDFHELLRAYQNSPEVPDASRHGCNGAGWRVIPMEFISSEYHPLCAAWRKISDHILGGSIYEATRLHEVSLAQIFGKKHVTCEYKKDIISSDIYIRFIGI